MHRKLTVLFVLAATVLLVGTYEAQGPAAVDTPSTSVQSTHQAGMILNIDPATGRIVENPVVGAEKAIAYDETDPSFGTSGEGLEQIRTANGVRIYLEGRFQNAMTATVNADGSVSIPCQPLPAAAISASDK